MKYIYTLKQALQGGVKNVASVKCHSNVKLQVKVTRVQGYNVTHKSYNDVKC